MTRYTKDFVCKSCKSADFNKIYNFSVDFKNVNFSDSLIYDINPKCVYVCIECGERYSYEYIQESIQRIIDKYKNDEW